MSGKKSKIGKSLSKQSKSDSKSLSKSKKSKLD
jgi:hypothetical protein